MIGFELKTLLHWSSYFLEISLMLGFISSSSHSKVKTMMLCRSSTQLSFLCPQSCWTILRLVPVTNQKYMQCFDVRWHACILTWFEIQVPPSSMFHHHKVPLFAFPSFHYSFNVLAHSCASLPLKCKCSAHLGLSTTITTLVDSQAWPCFQVWCCSIHHKGVEQIILLLDSLKNCPLIGCTCFANTHQEVF